MITISEAVLNKKVVGIYHNYKAKILSITLEGGLLVEFSDCVIVFDLGIVGFVITYISDTGTLGMTLELKKINENPDDYNYIIMSRDIKDFQNKNEIVISYKEVSIKNPAKFSSYTEHLR